MWKADTRVVASHATTPALGRSFQAGPPRAGVSVMLVSHSRMPAALIPDPRILPVCIVGGSVTWIPANHTGGLYEFLDSGCGLAHHCLLQASEKSSSKLEVTRSLKGCRSPLQQVLWHSILSHYLQCQHPTLVPVHFLAAPVLIQLPANSLGEAAEDGSGHRPLQCMWKIRTTWKKVLAPFMAEPGPLQPSGECTSTAKICLSLSLCN